MIRVQMLTKFISIGSYSPEVRVFGTLIESTKVFRLIICKTLRPRPQHDPLLKPVPKYLQAHHLSFR